MVSGPAGVVQCLSSCQWASIVCGSPIACTGSRLTADMVLYVERSGRRGVSETTCCDCVPIQVLTHESEVQRVEEQHHVLALVLFQAHVDELLVEDGCGLELRTANENRAVAGCCWAQLRWLRWLYITQKAKHLLLNAPNLRAPPIFGCADKSMYLRLGPWSQPEERMPALRLHCA